MGINLLRVRKHGAKVKKEPVIDKANYHFFSFQHSQPLNVSLNHLKKIHDMEKGNGL